MLLDVFSAAYDACVAADAAANDAAATAAYVADAAYDAGAAAYAADAANDAYIISKWAKRNHQSVWRAQLRWAYIILQWEEGK